MSNTTKSWQERYSVSRKTFDVLFCITCGYFFLPEIDFFVHYKSIIGWALIGLFVAWIFVMDVLKGRASTERHELDKQARIKREELWQLQQEERALVDQIRELWFDPWAQVTDTTIIPSPEGEISVQAVVLRFNDGIQQPGKLVLVFDPVEGFVRSIKCQFVDGETWSSTRGAADHLWAAELELLSWVERQLLLQHWSELAQVVKSD